MLKLFSTIWNDSRAPGATGPLRRDWVLVTVLALVAIIEGSILENVTWRYMTIALTIGVALTLPWRRIHPLKMVIIAFGLSAVVQTIALGLGVDWRGLNCNMFVVIFPYALLRWGSGRESILGVVLIAVLITPAMIVEQHSWLEILGAGMFILIPAALGATMRYQDRASRSANDRIRLEEREQLARELHDTVAHHVSAIAIQAQAGRALAATQPEAPLEVLGVIEEAASRTLVEMRQIVSTLRENSLSVKAPVATLEDIKRLVQDNAYPLHVTVNFKGKLDEISSAIQSTLFRLTQEALTNAARHAKAARNVNVEVKGDSEKVWLTVIDDGDTISHVPSHGLGLRGMAERVEILGGSIHAEAIKSGGWKVEAILPKYGTWLKS